jgi:hypothetical protein
MQAPGGTYTLFSLSVSVRCYLMSAVYDLLEGGMDDVHIV